MSTHSCAGKHDEFLPLILQSDSLVSWWSKAMWKAKRKWVFGAGCECKNSEDTSSLLKTTWKALLCNACGAVGWYPRTSQKGGGKSQIQVAKSLFVGSDWNWQPRSSFASLRAAGRVFRASATRKTDTRRLSTLLLTTTIACCRHPHGSGFAASQNPKPQSASYSSPTSRRAFLLLIVGCLFSFNPSALLILHTCCSGFPVRNRKNAVQNQTLLSSSRFCFALLGFFTPFSFSSIRKEMAAPKTCGRDFKDSNTNKLVDVLLNHVSLFLILSIFTQVKQQKRRLLAVISCSWE